MSTKPTRVCEYKTAAQQTIDKKLFDYQTGASFDGITYEDNEKAYTRYKFRPKLLRGLTQINTKTSILGQDVMLPIGIAPFSFASMLHPTAEIGLAQACRDLGTCFIQSNGSYYSMEELVEAVPNGIKWLQFYYYKERTITANLVKRAERLGYKAVVFTVDHVVMGRRIQDLRNKYRPTQNRLGNYDTSVTTESSKHNKIKSDPVSIIEGQMDEGMTWKDLSWIKQQTALPVVAKGIMTGHDADEAVRHGADAVIVSNHGGRQLDGVPATIDVLDEVVKAVNGRCEVYLDGGIRLGTDVLKALAIGAKAVFIGRPASWALAVNGGDGVRHVLEILKEELEVAMALCGVSSVTSVDRDIVQHYEYTSNL